MLANRFFHFFKIFLIKFFFRRTAKRAVHFSKFFFAIERLRRNVSRSFKTATVRRNVLAAIQILSTLRGT